MYLQNQRFLKTDVTKITHPNTFSNTIDFSMKNEFSITNGLSQIKKPVKIFHCSGKAKITATTVEILLMVFGFARFICLLS
jgi:uncharacterized protein with WD repeat